MQIPLGDTVNISQVAEIKAQLVEAMASDSGIELDVSKVERVDAAALQLFAAFALDAAAQGQEVDWGMPSEAFLEAAQLTGLSQVLKLD